MPDTTLGSPASRAMAMAAFCWTLWVAAIMASSLAESGLAASRYSRTCTSSQWSSRSRVSGRAAMLARTVATLRGRAVNWSQQGPGYLVLDVDVWPDIVREIGEEDSDSLHLAHGGEDEGGEEGEVCQGWG